MVTFSFYRLLTLNGRPRNFTGSNLLHGRNQKSLLYGRNQTSFVTLYWALGNFTSSLSLTYKQYISLPVEGNVLWDSLRSKSSFKRMLHRKSPPSVFNIFEKLTFDSNNLRFDIEPLLSKIDLSLHMQASARTELKRLWDITTYEICWNIWLCHFV